MKDFTFYTPSKPLIGMPKLTEPQLDETPRVEKKPKDSIPVYNQRGDIRYDDYWDFGSPKQKEKCQRRGPINRTH